MENLYNLRLLNISIFTEIFWFTKFLSLREKQKLVTVQLRHLAQQIFDAKIDEKIYQNRRWSLEKPWKSKKKALKLTSWRLYKPCIFCYAYHICEAKFQSIWSKKEGKKTIFEKSFTAKWHGHLAPFMPNFSFVNYSDSEIGLIM